MSLKTSKFKDELHLIITGTGCTFILLYYNIYASLKCGNIIVRILQINKTNNLHVYFI